MDHLYSVGACSVRLTAKIQKLSGYWMATVSKVEFYDKDGTIKDTVKIISRIPEKLHDEKP